MKILFFSSKLYDKESFEKCNQNYNFGIEYTSSQLNEQSVSLATGYDAICTFVNDHLNENILKKLYAQGVKIILLRCAGFNNIDLEAAKNSDLYG
jgi:D-lactate dehydrogenase